MRLPPTKYHSFRPFEFSTNKSDNSSNPVPMSILLDEDETDDKANSEDDVEMNLEAEESAEAELGRKNIFLLCI